MANQVLLSVIIVNYNGKRFLKDCLDSVLAQKKLKGQFEVIVVDNDSSDNSITYLKSNYPEVRVIESKKNLGFAGGNNLGVAHAKGTYVVLLNNDTKVDSFWLYYLLERIESDPKIAAVNSKALLYYPFVQISIESDIFLKSEFTDSLDFQNVGVAIEEVVTVNPALQRMIQYYHGFYKPENNHANQIPIRWTTGDAQLLVGIDPIKHSTKYILTVRAQKNKSKLLTNLKIKIDDTVLVEDTLKAHEVKQYTLDLKSSKLKKSLVYEVQNAGNIIFRSGHSRDRGAVVANRQQYYEIDNHFFKQPTQIDAICGVSVIIRKNLFTKLGGFDESFFLYYEDVDLSLRLRRMGYTLYFEPRSILYHIHAGSSVEWSPFFIYHVEKNHLALLLKHFPWKTVICNVPRYYALFFITLVKMVRWRITEHWQIYEEYKEKVEARQKVLKWFWSHFTQYRRFRVELQHKEVLTMQDIYETNY